MLCSSNLLFLRFLHPETKTFFRLHFSHRVQNMAWVLSSYRSQGNSFFHCSWKDRIVGFNAEADDELAASFSATVCESSVTLFSFPLLVLLNWIVCWFLSSLGSFFFGGIFPASFVEIYRSMCEMATITTRGTRNGALTIRVISLPVCGEMFSSPKRSPLRCLNLATVFIIHLTHSFVGFRSLRIDMNRRAIACRTLWLKRKQLVTIAHTRVSQLNSRLFLRD